MKINKPNIEKLIVVFNSIFISIVFYITNGKDQIALLYPIPIIIFLIILISFNVIYIYRNAEKLKTSKEKGMYIKPFHIHLKEPNLILLILSLSFVLSFPLVSVYPVLYFLMGITYISGFIFVKRVGLTVICVLSILIVLGYIHENGDSNYFKHVKQKFTFVNEKIDLGFSPSKKFYAYCINNKLVIDIKKNTIELVELTITDFAYQKTIEVPTCAEHKIKWITDEEMEVDNVKRIITGDDDFSMSFMP